MSLPQVWVHPRGAQRIHTGHFWIYASDVEESQAQGGDMVQVLCRDESGGSEHLGVAFFNPDSLISLRFIHRGESAPDVEFWRRRLALALAWRKSLDSDDTACRLVYAEADGIPGLVLDRYAEVCVLQCGCAGTEKLMPMWLELIQELVGPKAIVERNESGVRKKERLPRRKGLVAGSLDGPVEISSGGLHFSVDVLEGQKTGMYLDQRENHQRAGFYAHGRCLDVFSYQGGFGLHMAKGGAESVTLVDQSERALAAAEEAARLNGLDHKVQTLHGNAFDILKAQQRAGEQYDVISLDPPAFAKNRRSLEGAYRGYKEINLRAMMMLKPGGLLLSSSCSYHMGLAEFEGMLQDAAMDVGRSVQLLERRIQSRDHPELLGFPESRYLKCYILRVL